MIIQMLAMLLSVVFPIRESQVAYTWMASNYAPPVPKTVGSAGWTHTPPKLSTVWTHLWSSTRLRRFMIGWGEWSMPTLVGRYEPPTDQHARLDPHS